MLINFFLLFYLCEFTVTSWDTTATYPTLNNASITSVTEARLQLVATPDHPVVAGQRVDLYCNSSTMPESAIWSWKRLKNSVWEEVSRGRDLTLTKPEQSGLYCCCAESNYTKGVSANHSVSIIPIHTTVGEKLGIAAFVLSLLALIICLAILFWLVWQRFDDTVTSSNAAGFPGPDKSPKGGLPKTVGDGDVYMNYTSTNQAYSDLDPNSMTGDNVYSSLS